MSKILVVDDEPVVRSLVRTVLERDGHSIEEARDGNEGLEAQERAPADLVIVDLLMPNKHGLDTVLEMREARPDTRFIVMTGALPALLEGNGNLDELLGADVVKLTKPLKPDALRRAVQRALGAGAEA